MFYCMHSKSFSGHYDDAMLVGVNNTGVYIKENCGIIFSMHMVFDILDMKFLVKFATNRLDPFLVIK